MWFIFPQLKGLGSSATALHFGLASLAEAEAYFEHPLLGPRLSECTRLVLAVTGKSVHGIFGSPDDLKFCSAMTLFSQVTSPDAALFQQAIDQCCGGNFDPRTLDLLGKAAKGDPI